MEILKKYVEKISDKIWYNDKDCLKVYSLDCFWQVKDCLKMYYLACFWQVIVERALGYDDLSEVYGKNKFMPRSTMTASQFYSMIRRRIVLGPEIALFFMIGNTIPTPSATMGYLYEVRCCGIHLHGKRIP